MSEKNTKEIKTVVCESSIIFENKVNKLLEDGYELKNTAICEMKDYETSGYLWTAILHK